MVQDDPFALRELYSIATGSCRWEGSEAKEPNHNIMQTSFIPWTGKEPTLYGYTWIWGRLASNGDGWMSDGYIPMNDSSHIKDHNPGFVSITSRLQTARTTGVKVRHLDDFATTAACGNCAEAFSTGKRRPLIWQE